MNHSIARPADPLAHRGKMSLWPMIGAWLVLAAACSASCAPTQTGEVRQNASAFELRPGVVIDLEHGKAYLMNPQRGIDAIELSSGQPLWSTTVAAKPLALFDERLVAQAETSGDAARVLPIVVLDTKRDGDVAFKTSLPLPAGIVASVDEGLGTSFAASAGVEQGQLAVWWTFSQRTVSGVVRSGPPRECKEEGAGWIDAKTGNVDPLTPGQAMKLEHDRSTLGKLPSMGGPGVLESQPQRVGDFVIATQLRGSSERTIIKRWNAGSRAPLPDIELAPEFSVANPSADGRYLLTRKAAGADASGWQSYIWSVYSLASGQQAAEIRMPTSAAPFFLWQSILVYESRPYGRLVNGKWLQEPLELRAVNIKSGSEVWKRPLRDTAYRGPLPPRP
jgi:hypothetical protein